MKILENELTAHEKTLQNLREHLPKIAEIGQILKNCIKNGGKIMICGNGGSAGDSQHFAAEIVGRYKKERRALPAIALTTDSSALTAIGNDYGFDTVFSRQVEGLGRAGDVIFGISTSGNSQNVLNAFEKAREIGITRIFLGGKDGGRLKNACDFAVIVGEDTPRIQEMHIIIVHMLSQLLDDAF